MALTLFVLLVSLAGAVLAMRGLVAFRQAGDLIAAGKLDAARAAHRMTRRTFWPGMLVLSISLPAAVFALAERSAAPKPYVAFAALLPALAMATMATVLLVVDLRLQDKLRATPPAAAGSPFDESMTFDFTADHLWRSQMQWQLHSTLGRTSLAVSLLVILAVLLGMPLVLHSAHPDRPLIVDFIPSIVSVLAMAVLFAFFGRKLLVLSAGGRPGVLCAHTIEVRADGLREKTEANDTLWQWRGVKDLIETSEFVILRVSSIGMFAIPNSAFSSDDQRRRFVNAIRGRMSAPGAAVPTPA